MTVLSNPNLPAVDPTRTPLPRGGRRPLTLALVIAVLAAALRFFDLGMWPYSGDETASLYEERSLFHGVSIPPDSQTYRLPRLIPASYLAFHISHELFGRNEWGTRVVIASLGVLSVMLVYWLLSGPFPPIVATVSAMLVALLPQHVLHSQETRFYMVAAFFAFATLLLGSRALSTRSTLYAVLAVVAAFLAVLAHTLLVLLLPLLMLAVGAATFGKGGAVPRATWIVFAAGMAAMVLVLVFYMRPLLGGWNEQVTWGYSVSHAVLASVVMLGWPLTLLTVVGLALLLQERTAQGYYWAVCCLGWLGATLVLPLLVPYHTEYVFPLVLGAIVAAAYAISVVNQLLRTRAAVAAVAWLGLSCLANLPALASYYVDGSRWNLKTAAAYVRSNWLPGDRVAGDAMGLFHQYAAHCCEPLIAVAPGSQGQLAHLVAGRGRLWIVLENTRAGLEPHLQRWLFDCAVHKLSVGGRRFDDAQFSVEVYLAVPPANSTCTGSSAAERLR